LITNAIDALLILHSLSLYGNEVKEWQQFFMNRFLIFFIIIKSKSMSKIVDRIKAPTPKFFKVLRNVGLIMAGVGTVLLTAPVSLPAAVVTIGGYLVTAGGVATAVSQITNIADDAIGETKEGGIDGDGNSS